MIFGNNKSLACFKPNPNASLRIFCFPCAGGGASMYRSWSESLIGAEVWAISYPGRESLHGMPFADSATAIVDMVLENESYFSEKPFAVYGHSFGALMAYQVAHALELRGIKAKAIFVSARRAPQLQPEVVLTDLSDSRFLMELDKFDGIPAAIRQNQEMLDFYLPIIKADLELNDRTVANSSDKVTAPVYLFSAVDDKVARSDELADWKEMTSSRFEHKVFGGGHFFIQDSDGKFLAYLNRLIAVLTQPEDDDLIAY